MKIIYVVIFCFLTTSLLSQDFNKSRGFSYKQGVLSSINGSNWANQQDFFVNEFSFNREKKLNKNFYLQSALRGSDRKGYFNTTFATNAITKDTYLEIPFGFKYYNPLRSTRLFLSMGLEVFSGVSIKQDRYFDTNVQIPDDYESTVWLSNINLGFGGEVSLLYSINDEIWLSCGYSSALDLANFSENDNYQATKFRRQFLSIGVVYVKE